MPSAALLLLILSPFALSALAPWLVRRWPAWARVLALWPALLAAAFAAELAAISKVGPRLVEWPWAPSLGLSLSFHLDGLALLFAVLITAIGSLVVLYAARYLEGAADRPRFFSALFAFMGAMLGVVLSDNVLTLFVFWELTGFTSFLLIGFDHENAESRAAALQALLVTGGGGLALLAAGVLIWQVTGTLSLSAINAGGALLGHSLYGAVAALVLLAAFTKSAQVPFHFWLPNAMAAPTPVSAYLHSATMVKAGVYLVARMTPALGGTALWTTTVTAAGAVTMVVGAWRAAQEVDLKRILAYSTLSALGVMTMLLGLGTREAIVAATAYLVAHACYKGALFLVAGAVDHETGTRDIRELAGLRPMMPRTAVAAGAAAVSMVGVPLTLGFMGKETFYEALLPWTGAWGLTLLVAGVFSSILLGFAGLLAGVSPFRGEPGPAKAAHEAPWELWAPSLALAAAGLIGGIAPGWLNAPLTAAVGSITRTPGDVTLYLWHGFTAVLLMSVLTLVAIGLVYPARRAIRERMWRVPLGTEQLYSAGLGLLQAISERIAPALHSASLRSYLMVIVVTSVVLIGAALAMTPEARAVSTATSVQLHELLIVVVIVAGALSAARAGSTMGAVLALGTVGYGVALMFLSFGAPDLAMTQFSVETLTVVIYVLVFRHFRTLGTLSPRIVRWRDALIAGGIGLLIGGLVLSVGTSGTPSRLSGYFVEHAPTLAHGRNIVNVILVDFRAFDTFAEITVLATAAIGVRALLRLAAAERAEAAARREESTP